MTSASDPAKRSPAPLPSGQGDTAPAESREKDELDASEAHTSPIPIPSTTPRLFLLFLVSGVFLLLFTSLTVHRRSIDELIVHGESARGMFAITHWIENGYFASAGLLVRKSPKEPFFFIYRSTSGGQAIGPFLAQKVHAAITGRTSWRLYTLYNQIFSMLTASLMALLGFRLARRCGATRLHALILAVSLQAVLFTFPGNLYHYWGLTGREYWLFFAAIFLLIEDRGHEHRTRRLVIAQAASAFLLTYMAYTSGLFFLASFSLASLVFFPWISTLRRLAKTCLIPAVLALTLFALQLGLARLWLPSVPMEGSGFLFRTGLDGAATYYTSHLDIAFGRDVARVNFPVNRETLFHWPWVFIAGTIAFVSVLAAAARGRVPRGTLIALIALIGAYVLQGAVFSQSFVIHPYLYDVLLFTPLALTLFVIVPSLVETATKRTGVIVLVALFVAFWLSWVQLRDYMLMYPRESAAALPTASDHLFSDSPHRVPGPRAIS